MKVTKYHVAMWGFLLAFAMLVPSMLGVSHAASAPSKKVITLTSKNTVVLDSEVTGDSIGNVLEKATDLADDSQKTGLRSHFSRYTKTADPIYLFLNTPGGSIQAGLELIEGLNGLDRPVHSITAFSASMGLQIAQGLNGKRYILDYGVMMGHRGAGGFEGQFGGLEPSQAYNRYRIWAQRLKEMDERTVSRTGGKQTLESYQKAYNSELWLTGPEAVDQGYADELVQIKCDSSLSGTSPHDAEFMGFPIQYELDNCPINSSPRNVHVNISTNHGSMLSTEFKEKNGSFGPLCLQVAVLDSTKLCALNTELTYEKIEQIKIKFVNSYEDKKEHAIPLIW